MVSPQKLSLDCTVQRDLDVIAAEAGEDIVMVNIANGVYYGVSDIAREIWEAIEPAQEKSPISSMISPRAMMSTDLHARSRLCHSSTVC